MLFTILLLFVVGIPLAILVNAWIARMRNEHDHGYPHATDGGPPTVYRRPEHEGEHESPA
jgi:hypothetical protein